jgi:dihydroflavonol-4-reductase
VRVLVTGATGFIGQHVVRSLVQGEHHVTALVRPTSAADGIDTRHVEVRRGDVLDRDTLVPAARGAEALVHVAGRFAYGSVAEREMERLNVEGTRNVLEAGAVAGVGRVVITSSSVVFGSSPGPVVRDETAPFDDPRPPAYYVAKHRQHVEALELADRLDLELVAACPTVTMGGPDRRSAPSNAIVTAYLDDPWKVTWSGGINVVDVRDVAAGHVVLLTRGRAGEAYLIGGENLEWRQVHTMIADLSGVPSPSLTASRTAVLLGACWQEWTARLSGGSPTVTRDQSRTIGRYYWYASGRAEALGYRARPAHDVLVEAVAWLARHPHLSATGRAALRLSPSVRGAQSTQVTEGWQ